MQFLEFFNKTSSTESRIPIGMVLDLSREARTRSKKLENGGLRGAPFSRIERHTLRILREIRRNLFVRVQITWEVAARCHEGGLDVMGKSRYRLPLGGAFTGIVR